MALFLLLIIYSNINSKYISTFVFYGNYCMKKKLPLNQSLALVFDFKDPTDFINIFIR